MMLFCTAMLLFGGLLSHPRLSLADHTTAPNDPDHFDMKDMNRRLQEINDLRTKDMERVDQLITRITKLEDRHAKDDARITELVDLHTKDEARITNLQTQRTKDEAVFIRRMRKLEKQHAIEMTRLARRISKLESIRVKDVSEVPAIIAELESKHAPQKLGLGQYLYELKSASTGNIRDEHAVTTPVNESDVTSDIADGGSVSDTSSGEKKEVSSRKSLRGSPTIDVTRRVTPSTGTIALSAFLQHNINDPAIGQTIKFNKVVTNVGGHYNGQTGIFTCTQPGVHVFSWAVRVYSHVYVSADLYRNGAFIGPAIVSTGQITSTSMASATVALDLAQGDEVWVNVGGHSTGADVIEIGTMFTGFRLP